jgi:predicted N-acyltransferase
VDTAGTEPQRAVAQKEKAADAKATIVADARLLFPRQAGTEHLQETGYLGQIVQQFRFLHVKWQVYESFSLSMWHNRGD